MIILGAGMAGLLAGNMLRRFKPTIYECQPALPNNHSALLRFKTDAVSIATSIPFKKVRVQKAVLMNGKLYSSASLRMQNMYSKKVTGIYMQRSIKDLSAADRYIAPADFNAQAANNLNINYSATVGTKMLEMLVSSNEPIISTLPMPSLLEIIGLNHMQKSDFNSKSIHIATADIDDCNLYQTVYAPSNEECWYRASITGSKLILEFAAEITKEDAREELAEVLSSVFGIENDARNFTFKTQKYGKLQPLSDEENRKRVISSLTDNYNIYSLGRFAVWKQIMMDDVVKDIAVIENLIHKSPYDRKKVQK